MMVWRVRISRIHRGKKEFFTCFGSGHKTKKLARESAKRLKSIMGVENARVVKRKTKGNLRALKHKFPLSRYKTQTQSGTTGRKD